MNKKLIWIILGVVLIGGGSLTAYYFLRSSDKHLQLIPKSSVGVLKMDLKSLNKKLSNDGEFKKTVAYKKLMKLKNGDKDDVLNWVFNKVMEDPVSSGINFNSPAYMFIESKDGSSFGYVFDIRDIDNFNRMILKMPKVELELKKTKEFFFIKASESTILSWNENGLMVFTKQSSFFDEDDDEDVLNYASDFMTQKKENSITASNGFGKFNDNGDDVSMFINYANIGDMKHVDKGTKKLMKEYEGVTLSIGLNFEDDKVVANTQVYGNNEALDKFKVMNEKGVSDLVIGNLNNGNSILHMTLNVNVLKLIGLIERMIAATEGEIKLMENLTKATGLTESEIKNMLTGEVGICLESIDMVKLVSEVPRYDMDLADVVYERREVTRPMPIVNIVFGSKNKASIEKMMSRWMLPDSAGVKVIKTPFIEGYIVNGEKCFFLSTSYDNAGKVLKSGSLNPSGKLVMKDEMGKYPSAFFISTDVNKLSNIFNREEAGIEGRKIFDSMKAYCEIFADIKGHSDNSNNSEMTLYLKKGQGNSLFRIAKQLEKLPID
ncbi:MAG TPA: DUF4836 family protein [Bacteroidia bacterium]